MLFQEATNARKTQINSMIKSLKDKVLEKRKEVEQFNQKSREVQAQVADIKSQVQTNVDQIIAIIEARMFLMRSMIKRTNHLKHSQRKKAKLKIK